MSSLALQFIDPLMVWADVAWKTGELLSSSSAVIQARTRRMAAAGLLPGVDDQAEFELIWARKSSMRPTSHMQQ